MPADNKKLANKKKVVVVATQPYNLVTAAGDYIKTQSLDQITANK